MEFLQTAEPGNRRNHLLFHRSPAHCHRLRYPLFHFQLYLRHLFPDKDHHIRRPGRRFPHPDSRYSVPRRHPTVLIGRYRRVYRTYFQRDQKTPCLYRIGLQWEEIGIWRIDYYRPLISVWLKRRLLTFPLPPQLITVENVLPHIIHTA